MVSPSSTPRFFGSLTWKVPLLGTTDSVTQTHNEFNTNQHQEKQIILFIQLNIGNYETLSLRRYLL